MSLDIAIYFTLRQLSQLTKLRSVKGRACGERDVRFVLWYGTEAFQLRKRETTNTRLSCSL